MTMYTLLDYIDDLVFVMKKTADGYFRYEYINQHARKKFGFSDADIGRTMNDVNPEPEAQELNEKYQYVDQYGEKLVFLMNRDGTTMETTLQKLPSEYGEATFMSVVEDLTETLRESKSYQEQIQRYESLFANNRSAVIELSACKSVKRINPAAEEVFALQELEAAGRSADSLISVEEAPRIHRMIDHALQGRTGEDEWTIVSKDGKKKSLQVIIMPIRVFEDITGIFITARDMTKTYEQQEQIRYLSYTDALTDLPNRSRIRVRLTDAMAEAMSDGVPAALFNLDIDDFKKVNDAVGKEASDKILVELGCRLRQACGVNGTVARVGGDEFIVLLPGEDDQQWLNEQASSLLQCGVEPFQTKEKSCRLSLSVGAAVYSGEENLSADEFMSYAELAMFSAKQAGKNTVTIYQDDMNATIKRKARLEHDLRQGIQQGQFVLRYQPITENQSGRILRMEVLVRWDHPEYGRLSPAEFIPIAEESGLIVPLGIWILEEACKELKKLNTSASSQPIRLAINISVKQLEDPAFFDQMTRVLDRTETDPSLLDFEVTETRLMENITALKETLNAVRELGITLAIDDFGTGYSSMGSLMELPFDTLKIDQSFIQDVYSDTKKQAVLRTVMHLASDLQMRTVAEGVETAAERQFLRDSNIDEIQGYYVSYPEKLNDLLFIHYIPKD